MSSTYESSASRREVVQTKGYLWDSSDGFLITGMDFFDSTYFIVNKILLKLVGLWPYETRLKKNGIRVFMMVLYVICVIPQCISLCSSNNDFDKAMKTTATLLYFVGISSKFFLYILSEKKIKVLYRNIAENWKLLETEAERNVLLKFSETGRLLAIGYAGYVLWATIVFVTLPAIPLVLDKMVPLANGSRPKIFVLDGEFLVDKLENYRTIYFFETISSLMPPLVVGPIDSTYALTVEQCVGLIAVVKLRLKLVTNHESQAESVCYKSKDEPYEKLVKATELHKKVLHFAQVLETSYSAAFLVSMAFNVLLIIVGSIVILINLNNPMELFRYGLIYVGLMIHMFYLNWPGQKLINSSGGIFYDAYDNEWYECSPKNQKLLSFMMLRSIEPLKLTCGGYYTMNFQNYGTLMKTSFSYITVFMSLR